MGKSSSFTGGKLSLKGDKKKSKKKSKKAKHGLGESSEGNDVAAASPSLSRSRDAYESSDDERRSHSEDEGLTAAEKRSRKFKRQQERKEMEKVVGLSHRERVEQFNEKLGKLTEHNDIPRVSAAGNG
ncbi:hypothetical protein ACHAWF_001792 [Thalassiosira exigua]